MTTIRAMRTYEEEGDVEFHMSGPLPEIGLLRPDSDEPLSRRLEAVRPLELT
jgi:hypothetical protein